MSKGGKEQRIVIGQHSCNEAIKANPQWAGTLWIQEGKERENQELIQLAERKKIKVGPKGKKFFNEQGDGHQGVAIAMSDRPRWSDELADNENSLVVFLDGITDPHNMGAILRTAWLLNVSGIFIPKNRRVDLTPTVCKVASGGVEHVPVESCHFGSQLEWFKSQNYWVHGLKEEGSTLLPRQKPGGKNVLIVGSEGKGIRSSTESFCDQFIRIPQVEGGSSYNASVAFALCAYEFTRHLHI